MYWVVTVYIDVLGVVAIFTMGRVVMDTKCVFFYITSNCQSFYWVRRLRTCK